MHSSGLLSVIWNTDLNDISLLSVSCLRFPAQLSVQTEYFPIEFVFSVTAGSLQHPGWWCLVKHHWCLILKGRYLDMYPVVISTIRQATRVQLSGNESMTWCFRPTSNVYGREDSRCFSVRRLPWLRRPSCRIGRVGRHAVEWRCDGKARTQSRQ